MLGQLLLELLLELLLVILIDFQPFNVSNHTEHPHVPSFMLSFRKYLVCIKPSHHQPMREPQPTWLCTRVRADVNTKSSNVAGVRWNIKG